MIHLAELITGGLSFVVGIVLDFIFFKPVGKSTEFHFSNALKETFTYSIGDIFIFTGLGEMAIFFLEIDNLRWKNGIFLFFALCCMADVVNKIILHINTYRNERDLLHSSKQGPSRLEKNRDPT